MEIKLNEAKCTGLSLSAPVQLAKDDESGNGFLIEAYTGEVVDRWWGMLAIEVDGIKAKKQIPVLMNHDPNQIVGYSTKTHKDSSFFVTGKFSEVTEKAREVSGLAKEGFPWQASIGVRPVKIMSLEKDGKALVNGKNLKGPAEVWLESEVFETSFVPLGADSNTSISTFSKFDEEPAPMGEIINLKEDNQMEWTLENLTKEAPDLLAQIQAEAQKTGNDEGLAAGITQERERVTAILAIDDADAAAKAQAITEGLSVEGSYKLFYEAEKLNKNKDLENLEIQTPESVGQQGHETNDDGKENFMDAVLAYQSEKKMYQNRGPKSRRNFKAGPSRSLS